MNLDDIFASKYLRAADLKGRDVPVTIASCELQKLPKGEQKLALYFKGKEKGVLLNKTNANRIAAMYGKDTDKWIGKDIVLFPTQVEFQGDMVDAIRVKGVLPNSSGGNVQTVKLKDAPGYGPPPGHPAAEAPLRDEDEIFNDQVPF